MKKWLMMVLMVGCLCVGSSVWAKNGLENEGFEAPSAIGSSQVTEPESWKVFSSKPVPCGALSTLEKKNGSQSMRFTSHAETNQYNGLAQTVEVKPGKRYEFSVYARNDKTEPMGLGRSTQISMEWKTADGKEISREYGPAWGADLSGTKWVQYAVGGVAPENAAQCTLVINNMTSENGARGVCYVDKAEFSQKP